jgi:hydroxymethylpyrimidine/phosphomethylpyrimidine kinase
MKTVLIIAGSDPGAGAGLQQDLKTATLLGSYGLTVITALTVQNSRGVQAVHPVAAEVVSAQLAAVLSDFPINAIKIGMLATGAAARAVAAGLKGFLRERTGEPGSPAHSRDQPPFILDPVLTAGQGEALVDEEGIRVMQGELFPLTLILTPNVSEAARLTGMSIETPVHLEEAARRLQALGPQWVLAKGGHLPGAPVDVLTDGKNAYWLENPRLDAPHNHGSGCLLATALAAHLANGLSVPEAVNRSRELVQQALRHGLPLGQGVGPVNPYAPFSRDLSRYEVLESLKGAAERLVREDVSVLIPEVMSNLGYATSYPEGLQDVAAFPARILKTAKGTLIPEAPAFGASKNVASLILTAMKFFPHLRSAMSIRLVDGIEDLAPKLHLRVAGLDQNQVSPEVPMQGGDFFASGVARVMKQLASWEPPPDLIYDRGQVGQEPMVRILGENPHQVVEKALALKNVVK